jgi:hypothetical protein
MTSSAPGGWSPYGGPVPDEPGAPQRAEPRKPWFLVARVLLEFFVIAGLAGWLYWKYHHDKTAGSGTSTAGVKSLNHQAVEQYITDRFQVTGVTCNDGANVPMTSNGATFPCTSSSSNQFVVTVTNKSTGDYTVRLVQPVQSPTPHHPSSSHHKKSHHKKTHHKKTHH